MSSLKQQGAGGSTQSAGFSHDLILSSSQAIVEARDYGILSWDEMAAMKSERALLQPRVKALTRSVALETRLRDSALKLVKLSLPASNSLGRSTTRQTVTKEQASAQLAVAEEKLEKVEKELWKVGFREGELGRKLLTHTAGILALVLRQQEESAVEAGEEFNQSLSSNRSRSTNGEKPLPSPYLDSFSPRSDHSKFEGAQFFAGNKEAINPLRQGSGSNLASPRLGGMNGFAAPSFDHSIYENQISELKNELAVAREGSGDFRDLERKVSQLQTESRLASEESRFTIGGLKSELMEERNVVDELRREVDSHLKSSVGSKDAAAVSRRQLTDLQRELEDKIKELELARNGSDDHEKDILDARSAATASAKQVSLAKLEMEEALNSAELAEGKLSELKNELEEERSRSSNDQARMRGVIQDLEERIEGEKQQGGDSRKAQLELSKMVEERRKLAQSVGDVIRRHRTRSILGPAIRDLPPFDDSSDHADLPAYLASSLESHFEKISEHVNSMDRTLVESKGKEVEVRKGHQFELSRIINEREKEKGEGTRSRDLLDGNYKTLQAEHSELQKSHSTLLSQSNSASAAQEELRELKSESAQIGLEFSTLQSKSANLEEELLALKKLHSKLQTGLETSLREGDGHRENAERAAKVLSDRNDDLATYQTTIKELEERAEVSANQEVAMLERLNEFTERLEQTRSEKRKLDTTISTNQTHLSTLQEEKSKLQKSLNSTESELVALQKEFATLSAKPSEALKINQLTETLQEKTDSLMDLQEELDEARERESSSRGKLLEELAGLQGEVSKLKTELRQEKRKIAPSVPGK